jgi:hypothetical protein
MKPTLVIADPTKSLRAPQKKTTPITWCKDRKTGLCYIESTSNSTATFLYERRPPLEDILSRAMLYATQCKTRYQGQLMERLEPSDLERVFPELVFPDHLLQEIIDAPQAITAKQMEVKFYAELTARPEGSIKRDMSGGKR